MIRAAQDRGALAAVAADLLALTLLTPPGELGADIAVGSTQRFGLPMSFGGPHAGYIAVRGKLRRQLPGRLVGVSVDADGKPAYRLALQAREQHIRREKATSNICTAQVLPAVLAAMYAVYHGPDGLAAIAAGAHRSAGILAATLRAGGFRTADQAVFDTVRAVPPGGREAAAAALARARDAGYNVYLTADGAIQVSCDETTTDARLREVAAALLDRAPAAVELAADPADAPGTAGALPAELRRSGAFLTHPVFHAHRSETSMMRYLRRLADADIALDRSMIPLGSCTMKLNAAAEMEPITWPEFASLHPFAPPEQAAGYRELISGLEDGARRDHRLRRGFAAAERRLPGRAGRAAGHPGLPPVPAGAGPHRLPDPGIGARHQRGQRRARRAAGGRGQMRRGRRDRPGRPARQAGRARRPRSPRSC